FDSDEAGSRAAERAFQFHERYPVDLRVLVLPEGQDPADFVLAAGDRAGEVFEGLVGGAVPLVEYMIGRVLLGRNLGDVEERARAASTASPSAIVARAQERGEVLQKIVAGLAIEPPASGGEPTPDYAEQVFLRLEEFALSRRIDAMRKQLERLNPLKDQTDYDA